MRWFCILCLLQILFVVAIALPPKGPSIHEPNALAVRDPGDVEAWSSQHENSLNSRAVTPPANAQMWFFVGLLGFGVTGAAVVRAGITNPEGQAVVLYLGISSAVALIIGVITFGIEAYDYALRRRAYRAELRGKIYDERRKKVKADQEDEDRERRILKEDNEEVAKETKMGFEIRELQVRVEKQEEEVRKLRRENDNAEVIEDWTTDFTNRLADLRKYIKDGDRGDEAAKEAEHQLELASDKKKNMDGRVKARDEAEKQMKAAEEAHGKQSKDWQIMAKNLQDKGFNIDTAMLIQILRQNGIEPGKDTGKRRRGLRSDGLPVLIREKSTNCEEGDCHRMWYTSHESSIKKRDAGSDSSPLNRIHDVRITPHDFDYRDHLMRRGTNDTNQNEDLGLGKLEYEEDCRDEEEKVVDGKKLKFNLRFVIEYGGDLISLILLAMMGSKGIEERWWDSLKQLGTFKQDGHEYYQAVKPGLTCTKFDLDGGDPAAWFGYVIDYPNLNEKTHLKDATKYIDGKPEFLLNSCKQEITTDHGILS